MNNEIKIFEMEDFKLQDVKEEYSTEESSNKGYNG